jgi:Thymidylate synthase
VTTMAYQAFQFNNATVALMTLSDRLMGSPTQPSPRGSMREMENCTVHIQPSRTRPHLRPGTSHEDIGFIEGAGLIAGVSTANALRAVAPGIDKFTDFYGEYGPRVNCQLDIVLKRLHTEPETRQAVLTMWDANKDVMGGHNDHPCTIAVTFRVRNGYLNQTVHMRSNDVYLGWSNDVVQFSLLHLTFAEVLGLKVGHYVHHADSMHLYEKNYDTIGQHYLTLTGAERRELYDSSILLHDKQPLRPFKVEGDDIDERWAFAQSQARSFLSTFDAVYG